jgi:hypothetical protein
MTTHPASGTPLIPTTITPRPSLHDHHSTRAIAYHTPRYDSTMPRVTSTTARVDSTTTRRPKRKANSTGGPAKRRRRAAPTPVRPPLAPPDATPAASPAASPAPPDATPAAPSAPPDATPALQSTQTPIRPAQHPPPAQSPPPPRQSPIGSPPLQPPPDPLATGPARGSRSFWVGQNARLATVRIRAARVLETWHLTAAPFAKMDTIHTVQPTIPCVLFAVFA